MAENDFQLRPARNMTQANPLHVANMAQNMARNAEGQDSVVFQKVAIICMGPPPASSRFFNRC